jgi:hypothetical protein
MGLMLARRLDLTYLRGVTDQPSRPEPDEGDHARAAMRQAIAERQNHQYQEAKILALRTLGPGWTPWMKLCLIRSDHRQTGDATPIATVYMVYRGEEKLTENSMSIRRMPDGRLVNEASTWP